MPKNDITNKMRQRKLSREVFVNENGAIDLASIMVGIIVIGLIGGVIAATVFAVIPWSQDNAAKQQLDSIATAENTYRGFASEAGQDSYANKDALADPKADVQGQTGDGEVVNLESPLKGKDVGSLLDLKEFGDDKVYIYAGKDEENKPFYIAYVTSASGNIFTVDTRYGATPTKTEPYQPGDGGDDGGGQPAEPDDSIAYGPVGGGASEGSVTNATFSMDPLNQMNGSAYGTRAEIDAIKAQDRQEVYWTMNAVVENPSAEQVAGFTDLSNEMFFKNEAGEWESEFYLDRYGKGITMTATDGTVYTQVGDRSDLKPTDYNSSVNYNDRMKIVLNEDKTIKSITLDYFGFQAKSPYKTYSQMQEHLKGATITAHTNTKTFSFVLG